MNKCLFIVLFCLNSFCYGYDGQSSNKTNIIDNSVCIIGINNANTIIAYYQTKVNPSKGDKKISFIICELQSKKVLAATDAKYMADYYQYSGGSIDDWTDEKYSEKAYYNFNKQKIDILLDKYEIKEFRKEEISFNFVQVNFLQRHSIDGLLENVEYSLEFYINRKLYKIRQVDESVCFIKEIKIKSIFQFNSQYLIIFQKLHKGFEEDDFYDYDFIFISL